MFPTHHRPIQYMYPICVISSIEFRSCLPEELIYIERGNRWLVIISLGVRIGRIFYGYVVTSHRITIIGMNILTWSLT